MKDDLWIATKTARLVMLYYSKGSWTVEEQDWAEGEIERIESSFRKRFPGFRGGKLVRDIREAADVYTREAEDAFKTRRQAED